MKKVIIFNAPPWAGKDTCADYVCKKLGDTKKEFKAPLKEMCARMLGIHIDDFNKRYEAEKDIENKIVINHEFHVVSTNNRMSLRQFMIHVSENVIKPTFGNDFFGQYAKNNLSEGWNIFSDGGFEEEVTPLRQELPWDAFFIVRIEREGCDFKKDSRKYLDCPFVKITNNGTIEELYKKLDSIIEIINIEEF